MTGKDEAVRLLEEALHLSLYGERAPGGDETWQEWHRKNEAYLRKLQEEDGGTRAGTLVLVNQFELLSVMQGSKMTVAAAGGEHVQIRLATAGELLEQAERARDALDMPEESRPPRMTYAEALGLTRPADL